MPWKSFTEGDEFCVHMLNEDGSKGEKVKCHATEDEAKAQVAALYASEPGMAKIAKIDEDERLVFGWAYISEEADGSSPIDSDGDSIEPAELEKGAYQYVLDFRDCGERHQGDSQGTLVESLVLTKEKAEAMGIEAPHVGWWVGMKIHDADVFAKVKSKEYQAFSIQGSAHDWELETP